jgi:hypothetical protein
VYRSISIAIVGTVLFVATLAEARPLSGQEVAKQRSGCTMQEYMNTRLQYGFRPGNVARLTGTERTQALKVMGVKGSRVSVYSVTVTAPFGVGRGGNEMRTLAGRVSVAVNKGQVLGSKVSYANPVFLERWGR